MLEALGHRFPQFMTKLDICNMALTACGTRNITSLDEQSKDARSVVMNYDISRKVLLRMHPWNFATKRKSLNTIAPVAPEFGFANALPLPDDFVRLHSVYDGGYTVSGTQMAAEWYRVEGLAILTNFSALNLKYVYDCDDVNLYDSLFIESLSLHLAHKIVYLLTGSDTKKESLYKEFTLAVQKARFNDSVEDPSEEFDDDVWLASRFGTNSGFVRDPKT